MDKKAYWQSWYKKNKKALLAKRKERYHTDVVFRQEQLQRVRRRKQELKREKTYAARKAARA